MQTGKRKNAGKGHSKEYKRVHDGWMNRKSACLKVMCIREPCAVTWAQTPPLLYPSSFSFCCQFLLIYLQSTSFFLSSEPPLLLYVYSLSVFKPTASPSPSMSTSLHQLQRAVSVADLEGTCLLKRNKIIRPPVPFCVRVCVACTD